MHSNDIGELPVQRFEGYGLGVDLSRWPQGTLILIPGVLYTAARLRATGRSASRSIYSMRVTINTELVQDCYLDGLGSVPSEPANQGIRISYINEISLGDRMQSYCMRLVLLDLEQYPGVENYYRTEDLTQPLIDERGVVTRVYCRYRLAWERMVPRCEHEGNCRGCYGLGDGSLVRDGYVGASEVEYGLENDSEPRDYRGPF